MVVSNLFSPLGKAAKDNTQHAAYWLSQMLQFGFITCLLSLQHGLVLGQTASEFYTA